MSLAPHTPIDADTAGPFTKRVREFCLAQRITLHEDAAFSTQAQSGSLLKPVRLPVSPRDRSKSSDASLQSLLERLKRWIALQNTHLIQFQGLYLNTGASQLFFISEASDSKLSNVIGSEKDQLNKLSCLQDILSGLSYLHRHQFVHGNIRGDNIFIKADGKFCLGEFAPARLPSPDCLVEAEAWSAPELFDSGRIRNALIDGWRDYAGEYTYASDLFAIGCIAVLIYTGEPPLPQRFPPNARSHRDLWALVRQPSPIEKLAIPPKIWPVISIMLRYNPKNRMSASQLLTALMNPNPVKTANLLADVPSILARSQARRLMRSGI
ncbi:kinase-like protein [Macrolepiota fuliginosa MF-IS2]|uniref:non-specific serine/threonine protein kinase n=1 Tax=Macrolepiota fuliginosa MF-IS2 TaxID=1400762 RepID=A0A9P5XD97_9AGAR|nr:kinase-like protein [Macrolepiota fuliginosa MF-IS2]